LYQLNQTCGFYSIFWPSKIHVSLTSIVSSLSHRRCRLSSDRCRHTVMSCHASFLWSQDRLSNFVLSFSNASSRHLPFRAKIEALSPHHRSRRPSPYRLTSTLHYYKKKYLNLRPPLSLSFTGIPCSSLIHTKIHTIMN
jgi:hypothetical protein